MKILFYPSDFPPIHAEILEERPLSGGPTTLIRLSEALAKLGHEVVVLTEESDPPPSNPLYLPTSAYSQLGKFDVLVAVRGWLKLFLPIQANKRVFWTGDSESNPQTYGIGDRRFVDLVDFVMAKSHWHAQSLAKAAELPVAKMKVLLNGVHLPYFQKKLPRVRKRLIYTSTPNRGLEYLIPIFRQIRAKHPDAELHVYSSFDRNSRMWPPHSAQEPLLTKARAEPGWVIHDSILQKDLAEAFLQSALLVYPCSVIETCASTTLEAQAAGCPIVTSQRESLLETVGAAGLLIPGHPGEQAYQAAFVYAVDRLLSDDHLWEKMSQKGLQQAKNYSWDKRAKEFLTWIS